jgi:hypothetical protein
MDNFDLFLVIVHILGATLLMGAIFVAMVSLTRKDLTPRDLSLIARTGRVTEIVSGIQLLTGVVMLWDKWDHVAHHPLIWIKLFLYVAVSALAGLILKNRSKKLMGETKISPADHQQLRAVAVWAFIILVVITTIGGYLGHVAGHH